MNNLIPKQSMTETMRIILNDNIKNKTIYSGVIR
jgi:hypothetical protein